MNIDLFIVAPLLLLAIIGGRREGERPDWARRSDMIAIPLAVLLILAGWVVIALAGVVGEWVMRLAYLPMAAMVVTEWFREK
jgi:hypothetical protein